MDRNKEIAEQVFTMRMQQIVAALAQMSESIREYEGCMGCKIDVSLKNVQGIPIPDVQMRLYGKADALEMELATLFEKHGRRFSIKEDVNGKKET